jgi:hypothetical protein
MSDVGRYRRLYANEWHDPAFRALDDDGVRVVRLYVSAGPQTTSVGCFRLSTAVAVEDLGGSAEDFERRLNVVCKAFAWDWDPLARVIWVTNWFDLNPPASPNVVHSWAKLMKNVPDCDVKTHAIISISKSLKDLPATFREPWRELSKAFPVSESQPQTRSETNQGSGIRDSGIREKRAGALRAVAGKTKPQDRLVPHPDARVIRIAGDVIHNGPREASTDYLIDALQDTCLRDLKLHVSRAEAIVALTHSQQDRTA